MQSFLSKIVQAARTGAVSPMEFDALIAQAKTFIGELFGRESWQLKHIESLSTLSGMTFLSVTPEKLAEKLFAVALSMSGMNSGRVEAISARAEGDRVALKAKEFDNRSVFIVHGHDHAALDAVSSYLIEYGLEPVVLKDEPNSGQTLLEKFLNNSKVGFAIILFTPDDLGRAKSQSRQLDRARQNVVLELGYFIGAIGRDRVSVLYVDGVELPSDIVGLAYVPFDETGIWKKALDVELQAAGYS